MLHRNSGRHNSRQRTLKLTFELVTQQSVQMLISDFLFLKLLTAIVPERWLFRAVMQWQERTSSITKMLLVLMNMEMRLTPSLFNTSNASYERMWTLEGDPGLTACGINGRRVYKHNGSNRRLLLRISEQLEERRRSGRRDWCTGVEPFRRFFLLTARRLVLKKSSSFRRLCREVRFEFLRLTAQSSSPMKWFMSRRTVWINDFWRGASD